MFRTNVCYIWLRSVWTFPFCRTRNIYYWSEKTEWSVTRQSIRIAYENIVNPACRWSECPAIFENHNEDVKAWVAERSYHSDAMRMLAMIVDPIRIHHLRLAELRGYRTPRILAKTVCKYHTTRHLLVHMGDSCGALCHSLALRVLLRYVDDGEICGQ